MMTCQWLADDLVMTWQWFDDLDDDLLMTCWWLADDLLITWWLNNDLLMTHLLNWLCLTLSMHHFCSWNVICHKMKSAKLTMIGLNMHHFCSWNVKFHKMKSAKLTMIWSDMHYFCSWNVKFHKMKYAKLTIKLLIYGFWNPESRIQLVFEGPSG